jgi:glucans biosynthesis protein C
MILGTHGLGHGFLVRGGAVLRYASEAAYPFSILHPLVIIGIAQVVRGWSWAPSARFALIAVVSFGLTLGIHEVAVRRWGAVRFLLGMKRPRRAATQPAAPRASAAPRAVSG